MPGQRVQVERQARDERLAFTGLHLGDVALVQDDPAHHLDVEDALVRLAHARLAHGGERLEEEVLERLAVLEPLAELDGLRRAARRRRASGTPARASRCRRPARRAASCAAPRRSEGPSRADPSAGIGEQGTARRRVAPSTAPSRLDLPEVAVEPARRGRRTRRPSPRPTRSSAGPCRSAARPSTWQRARRRWSTTSSASSPCSPGTSTTTIRERGDRPGRRPPPHGLRAVRAARSTLDRVGERRERRRRARPPRRASVPSASATKCTASPRERGRLGGRDGVPPPRARNAVDARLAPRLAVPARAARPPGRRRGTGRRAEPRARPPRPAARAAASRRRNSATLRPHVAVVLGVPARLDDAAARDSASPGARACRRAGRSTPSCRATPRARAASGPS